MNSAPGITGEIPDFIIAIDFHHIHHFSPRIPNYYLKACHKYYPLFREARPLALRGSLKSLSLRLWDEKERRLVGFNALAALLWSR